ncbi:MAG TPA: glycine cleavage system aminomethyltransferase GcvT, partial [Planctomycetaceae bacterium]|nr:glycine cleavage system aminomethyltransferase GcvT [Planctomycetaceae bacterium]
PLTDWHAAHGGRMVEFGGWEMPVQYTGIVEEHTAVRTAAGLFDISHMGRLIFQGPGAGEFLNQLVTSRVDNLAVGQIRYGLVCNEQGGILDDVLVYRLDDAWGLVVNASNRKKILDWIAPKLAALHVRMIDTTTESAMLALQGPRALEILQRLTTAAVRDLKYYRGMPAEVGGLDAYVSRTGYTGEDGFELVVTEGAVELWNKLLEAGKDCGLIPCGLGARDTLRLEAAMPLYGHELSESIDPLTAGLDFAVKLDKGPFVGREALIAIRDRQDRPVRVGLELEGRRIAREHTPILIDGQSAGQVTSGTFSPTLQKAIAMGYVPAAAAAAVGTSVTVDIRGKHEPARVVGLPFYQRQSR